MTLFTMQEAAFRKVIQATMIRDRQHGPVIEINRIQVHTAPRHFINVVMELEWVISSRQDIGAQQIF